MEVFRRLDAVESKLEGVSLSLKNASQVEMDREVSLKDRLEMWDKSLKEMSRGIQVIRDKQELLEAQAELAEMKKADELKRLLEAKKAEEAKKAQETQAAESAAKSAQQPVAPILRVRLHTHKKLCLAGTLPSIFCYALPKKSTQWMLSYKEEGNHKQSDGCWTSQRLTICLASVSLPI